MTIHAFVPTSLTANHVLEAIEKSAQREHVEVYSSVKTLLEELNGPSGHLNEVLVLAPSRSALAELTAASDVLERFRLVLILPDDNAGTITMGHSLRPRIIGLSEDIVTELPAVLTKMLRISEPEVFREKDSEPIASLANEDMGRFQG